MVNIRNIEGRDVHHKQLTLCLPYSLSSHAHQILDSNLFIRHKDFNNINTFVTRLYSQSDVLTSRDFLLLIICTSSCVHMVRMPSILLFAHLLFTFVFTMLLFVQQLITFTNNSSSFLFSFQGLG